MKTTKFRELVLKNCISSYNVLEILRRDGLFCRRYLISRLDNLVLIQLLPWSAKTTSMLAADVAIADGSLHELERYQKPKKLPPTNEVICNVPTPEGEFLRVLQSLRKESFAILMEMSPNTMKYHREKRVVKKGNDRVYASLAFRLYYGEEFDHLPLAASNRLFSAAWKACDHKHVWEYYAAQYSKYYRDVSFLEWLTTCPKHGKAESVIIFCEMI